MKFMTATTILKETTETRQKAHFSCLNEYNIIIYMELLFIKEQRKRKEINAYLIQKQ